MTEIKYEHPLEHYTVDNFIKESCKMIGQPVRGASDIHPFCELAKCEFIDAYALAMGDRNPLYRDLDYAVYGSRYNTVIAPPTFLTVFKYPISQGALFDGPYPLIGLESSFDWEWNDVVRMNDSFTTELILKEVYEKSSNRGRTIYLVSECKYLNKLSKMLVATCTSTYAAIARANSITEIPDAIKEGFGNYPITDRKIYHYSEEEVERIVKDIDAMVMRGSKPLYWEDVNEGDSLTPVVKAPLTTSDLRSYHGAVFSAEAFPDFGSSYRKWVKKPGFLRPNPIIGWPYDIQVTGHLDPHMGQADGMPYSFGMGSLKAGLCAHLLTNWMGDDGFVKRMKMDVLEPYIYGDALWIKGKVVDKYKEKIGGVQYGAVDIKIEAVNQLGQNIAPELPRFTYHP